jgi:methionine--tRNA ligase beta chain
MINIDQFKEIEIRIGKILSAEKVEGLDKILKLRVDFGELGERQILSGIAMTFTDPSVLVDRMCPFVTNLETRTIKGLESQGMILAMHGTEGEIVLLSPTSSVVPGSLVG